MRSLFLMTFSITLGFSLSACEKVDNKQAEKQTEEKPLFDVAPQRAQLQKAKELENKMQQDAVDQRKVIELQTNPK